MKRVQGTPIVVAILSLLIVSFPLLAAQSKKKKSYPISTHVVKPISYSASKAKSSKKKVVAKKKKITKASAKKTRHVVKRKTGTKRRFFSRKRHKKRKPSTGPIYGLTALKNELNKVVRKGNKQATVGVYIKSLASGDPLYSYNHQRSLTPASTMKMLTAEAALLFLGSDYRFSTQLLTDATSIKDGVLKGNLYIVLSGDPTLTYEQLVDLMLSLQNQGIHSVSGNVFIDNTAYDQRFYGPGWEGEDKSYCYGAPISASIINHNCLSFQVKPSQVAGRPAKVLKSSKYFYPQIKNSVVTKSARAKACSLKLERGGSSKIEIEGCMAKGRYAWGVSYVVTDIPEYNRALFKNLLHKLGIRVAGSVTFGSAPDELSLINMHNSEPLNEMINDMLKKSDNVIAGALFKKLGQLYTGKPGSWENGSMAVANILAKYTGLSVKGLRLIDGSGLSANNKLKPSQLMQVLEFVYRHKDTKEDFISALPISGVDGTLKNRLKRITRRVKAKTGTISGVASLAGYVTSAQKEPLAFVIMFNGDKGNTWRYKQLEDEITMALARYRRTGK